MELGLVILIAIVVGFVLLIALAFSMWKVAEPNEALIKSGFGAKSDESGLGFAITTGGGTFVIPILQRVRKFNLDQRQCVIQLSCLTSQRIPLDVEAFGVFKVGDSKGEIANAARRFLDKQNEVEPSVQELLGGHLRSIVGAMSIEEIIHDRAKLTEQVRESCSADMEKLGLIIDSLQIKHISDKEGYLDSLAKIQSAAVARDARIAEAEANRAATEAEQSADARNAEVMRETSIKRATYQAEIDQANAKAAQAGPLAETEARQQVVVQETKIAELEAQREEKRLDSEIRKQADAEAYREVTLAEAQREVAVKRASADAETVRLKAEADATKTKVIGEAEAAATEAKGLAEGKSIEAKGVAEANAIAKRAEALAAESDAVINQQLAKDMPEMIRAAAEPFGHIKELTVLNGGEGMMDMMTETITRAFKTANTVKGLLDDGKKVTATVRPQATIPPAKKAASKKPVDKSFSEALEDLGKDEA